MIENILRYYRACMADSERMDLPKEKVLKEGVGVPHLSKLDFKLVREKFGIKDPKEKLEKNTDPLPPVPIMISPISLLKRKLDDKRSEKYQIFPYWIPALLTENNQLIPPVDDHQIPWISRGVLEPNDYLSEEIPTLASLEKVDEISSSFIFARSNWEQYWKSAQDYFKNITGNSWNQLKCEQWVINDEMLWVLPLEIYGVGENILNLYDRLMSIRSEEWPLLLKKYLSFEPQLSSVPDISKINTFKIHLGQMGNQFPLSKSQRDSLVLSVQLNDGETLAVNGPPGTGKTTLLQSVYANHVVQSALEGKYPAAILTCSTNNQAITNVLDCCKKVPMPGGLFHRWLPDLESFGTYLISSSYVKLKEAQDRQYLVIQNSKSARSGLLSWYQDYVDKHSKETCCLYFLEKFKIQFPEANASDVKGMTEFLRERLIENLNDMDSQSERLQDYINLFETSDSNISVGEEKLGKWLEEQKDLEKDCDLLQALILEVRSYFKTEFFLKKIFCFIPSIRRKRESDLNILFQKHTSLKEISLLPVQSLLLRLEALHISSKVRVNEKSLKNKRAEDCLSNYRKFINLWNNLIACREPDEKAALSILWKTASLMEKLQLYCDLNHRFKSFWLAVHYWEGRWVLDRDDRAFEKLNKGKHSREKVFGLISYLTPFFVSTFHSAPKFVSYAYNDPLGSGWIRQPLYKFFDLLIVDEAGQVSPEVAVPSFALAKKAIVMGDVYQIEPISKIPSQKIDLSNMRKSLSVISETEFQKISDLGYACSSGSLMRMAQNLSKYKLPAENQFQGTLLQEHRRCVDEIIYFCNHFVYQNLLIPKVGSLDYVRGDPDLNLPALGYCHVPSYSEQNMGSRSNSVEAAAIAAWISRWKNDLLTVYGKGNPKGLKQILAIVTPFQAQKDVILKALKERNILDNITVGTVHGLQGSERPLILFSPVYGRQDKEANCFFDKGWNMLNVAVSRAKEHFLVFGNMDFFQPDRIDRPSGALASLLFASPKNALDDTFLFDDPIIPATFTGVVERISNLQTHRTCLIDSIVSAKKQILIVSPFISISALEADHLEKYLGDAVKRGVEVKVFTDAFLDMENRQLKPQSKKGREYLKKIGVEVKLKRGIHNKTLAVDDKILVEGSFNWLSASRDLSSPFQRQEASLIVKGEGTANDIIKVYQEMEKLEDY